MNMLLPFTQRNSFFSKETSIPPFVYYKLQCIERRSIEPVAHSLPLVYSDRRSELPSMVRRVRGDCMAGSKFEFEIVR